MTRSCTKCGKSLGETARFCSHCGTPAQSPPVVSAPVQKRGSAPTFESFDAGKWLPKLGVLILIAGIIFFVISKISSNDFRSKSTPPTEHTDEPQKVTPAETGAPAKPQPTATPPAASYPEWKPSASQSLKIPLVQDLTVVTAIAHPLAGDYESIKRIQAISNDAVEIAYSSNVPGADPNGAAAALRRSCLRTVQRQDLRNATEYRENFCSSNDESYPGTTAISISTQTLADLKSKGEASFKFQSLENGGPADQACMLKRVEATDVAIPVLVNDQRQQLPAVHGRCVPKEFDVPSEFYFLDDSDNPLALAWQLGSANKLQVVKITTPTNTPQIEQSLEQTGRAEVYGIYFDFGSASIRPESEPVLKEIADVLQKNPAWKLSIEGHTDNVGSDTYNLDLSRRRADAVKQALVERYRVTGARLTTAGFGASRPKETNDTLEGRARNRRVELVRQSS